MTPPNSLRYPILLCLVLLTALALRLYNVGFPSIGYHNMQENDYMSTAYNMDKTGDYITKTVYYNNISAGDMPAKADPQPPLVSYQTLMAWKLFGENLWAPRLINIAFGVLSILVIYLISGLLFDDRRISLFVAFSLAIMPLAVFFSRNLQPESPALFFMLLGNLLYLRFVFLRKRRDLAFGGIAFSAAWLYKFGFIIGALPFLLYLPQVIRDRRGKGSLPLLAAFAIPYMMIFIVIYFLYSQGQLSSGFLKEMKPLEPFSYSYWKEHAGVIWHYVKDENFNLVFLTSAVIGTVLALIRRKSRAELYIIGWAGAIIPYIAFFSTALAQNSYCQMPFVGFVCVSGAYAALSVSELLKKVFKKDLLPIVLVAVMAVAAPFARDSIMKMHSTVFAGVDVAGESLRGFTKPDEHIFLFTHAQGYGIARYARRYAEWTYGLEEFKAKENKYGIRYICIYPAELTSTLKQKSPQLFTYIQNNYHIKEAGLTEEPHRLFYLILEKGALPEPQNFLESISGKSYLKTIYRITDRYIFFYVLRPAKP